MSDIIDVNINEEEIQEVVEIHVDENSAQTALDAAALAQNALLQMQNIAANIADINTIIADSGFTKVDQVFTAEANSVWNINGLQYTNPAVIIINIPLSATGMQRWDRIVLDTNNLFVRFPGPEAENNPAVPPLPEDTLDYTLFLVTDSDVGDATPPIVGTQFKKKTENLDYSYPILKGTRAVIQLRPEGHSYYYLESSLLVSVDGFGLSLITGNPDAEMPYPMKDLFIHNTGTTPFTLLHNGTGSANSKFFFLDETDLVVPPGGKVWLKYGGTYCQLFLTSWTEQSIPTFQQVTDQGNVTNHEITAAAFRISNGEELPTKEWVENNNFAYRSELFEYVRKENFNQYNYAFLDPIDSIRLELPATESYLIINTLIESIKGFDVPFSDLFEGKDYFIYNKSSDEITLKHNYDNAIYDFNFKAGVNIKLPRRGLIHLKFIGGKFIDVNKSWEYFNELQGVNINNAGVGEVLIYNSSSQWENKNSEYIKRQTQRVVETDFMVPSTASAVQFPYVFSLINGGALNSSTVTNGINPGILRLRSATTPTANSGAYLVPLGSSLVSPTTKIFSNTQIDFVFRTPATLVGTGINLRFGLGQSSSLITDLENGYYIEMIENTLYGKTADSNTRSQTSTSYTTTISTWYHGRVKYISSSLVEYYLYNMDGDLLWSSNLTTNITNSALNPLIVALSTNNAAGIDLVICDYFSATYPVSNRGALN